MKIIVCMKQVPAGTKVDIDPETGSMKRLSGATRTNPYDLFALEAALQLREKLGGTVAVLTMGPQQAESMMRDTYTMGADEAVILSDRKFAGADVLATSYTLSQGVQLLCRHGHPVRPLRDPRRWHQDEGDLRSALRIHYIIRKRQSSPGRLPFLQFGKTAATSG